MDERAKVALTRGSGTKLPWGKMRFWPLGFPERRAKEDGWVLLQTPIETLGAGQFHRVPLLVGSNRDEGKIFTVDASGGRRSRFRKRG